MGRYENLDVTFFKGNYKFIFIVELVMKVFKTVFSIFTTYFT